MFLTRLVKEKPLGFVAGIIVLLFLIAGIFADWLAPYGVNEYSSVDYLHPPSFKYPLGADNLGRDMLSRVIFGARISMIVGLAAATVAIFIALLIGVPSGYFGGKLDMVVQRFVDGWMVFPVLILLLGIVSVVGTGMLQLIIVLGLFEGIYGSRIIRSAVIGIRENMYLEAAVAIGCPTVRIITRHILPNIMAPLIIVFSLSVPTIILNESGPQLPGFWHPPSLDQLGRDAQWLRTPLYVSRSLDCLMAWSFSDDCRLRHEYVWRRHERLIGPKAEGRCRALWRVSGEVSPKESFMIFGAEIGRYDRRASKKGGFS